VINPPTDSFSRLRVSAPCVFTHVTGTDLASKFLQGILAFIKKY
jgi:hypothetical protein